MMLGKHWLRFGEKSRSLSNQCRWIQDLLVKTKVRSVFEENIELVFA